MTEGEYTLITDSYLVDDMLTDECIDDAVECRRIHLFGIDESFFEFIESQRLSFLEKTLDMTSMDSRQHGYGLYSISLYYAYFCKCKYF